MDEAVVLPDIEALVVEFLNQSATVEPFGATIATETPADLAAPYIRVQRLAGDAPARVWRDQAVLQIDCYGEDRDAASLLARTCRAALFTAFNFRGELGVITSVGSVIGPRPLPDPSSDRDRWEFEVRVDAHPVRT